jgi:uncharacterized protein (TIGR02996 family)
MTDEHALLASIAADPEDDTARLAYADFVEENGDTDRAAFIRNQVELSRTKANDPAYRLLVKRNVRFLYDHVPGWRAELPQLPGITWGDFNRGLVEEVQAQSEAALVQYAAAIFAEPAIHIIRLSRFTSADDLGELPELVRVRSLRFISARASSMVLQRLFTSPYLGNLAVLDLHNNDIGNAGGQALAASTHLQQVRFLDLRGNPITDFSVRAALIRRFGSRVKL